MIQNRIDLDDAWIILERFAPFFVDVLLDYLDEMNSAEIIRIRGPMSRRSFCSTLADYFYSRMGQAPEHGSCFECLADRGQHYILFDDRVIIRVKQLDKKHLSWNLETAHATRWNQQVPLHGMDPAPRLELGYRLNGLMSGYDSIHILLRVGKRVDWRVQIYGDRTDIFDIEQLRLDGMGPNRKVYQYRPVRLPGERP